MPQRSLEIETEFDAIGGAPAPDASRELAAFDNKPDVTQGFIRLRNRGSDDAKAFAHPRKSRSRDTQNRK